MRGVEVAGSASSPHRVRADRGVVLASGGYQANSELRQLYQPERLAVTSFPGLATCRGDGHVMGQSVGAQLINMTVIPIIVMVASALLETTIAVNRNGERFHDETGPYDARVGAVTAQPEGDCHYVFDSQAATSRSRLVESLGSPPKKAATLDELAAIIGCDAATLRRTVQLWNDFLRSGSPRDPAFGRVVLPDPPLGIEVPPFYTSRITLGANFTAGGFRTNQSLRVLDVYGDPVAGLYAAGDCVGGVNVAAGLGGVHIASAIALGRVAGRSAATASVSTR